MNDSVKIGIIGDYDPKKISHKATQDALRHCGDSLSIKTEIVWLPTKDLEAQKEFDLSTFDGFWCSPGSPYLSYTGALQGIQYAREKNHPFIGTCGGFQHGVMEYACNVLGLTKVNHAEYNPDASEFFIAPLSCSLVGETKNIYLKKGSIIHDIYGTEVITERYNCSFGLNPIYQELFEKSGLKASGADENGEVRVFELYSARFYIATLFQPQLSSKPENPHPLILRYLLAVQKFHQERNI